MNDLNKNLDVFLNLPEQQIKKDKITQKDGLIERVLIDKKLIVEDGRELLKEDLPVSNTNRSFLR